MTQSFITYNRLNEGTQKGFQFFIPIPSRRWVQFVDFGVVTDVRSDKKDNYYRFLIDINREKGNLNVVTIFKKWVLLIELGKTKKRRIK